MDQRTRETPLTDYFKGKAGTVEQVVHLPDC
jgi:hypothetical protein